MDINKPKKQFAKIPDETEKAANIAVDSAYHVHMKTGPGLLERNYERFMEKEITRRGHEVKRQVKLPIIYDGEDDGEYYIIDMLVDDRLIIEIKAVETVLPVHINQLLTYLKLSQRRLGLLINFYDTNIGHGITRVIN